MLARERQVEHMFSIEVSFSDGVSQPEVMFVRRPQALIGAADHAHVIIDDMEPFGYHLRLIRQVGASFLALAVQDSSTAQIPSFLNKSYDHQAVLDFGRLQLVVTSLDSDLVLREGEPLDRAGARVLRQCCSKPRPVFPAVVVPSGDQIVVSFDPDMPILIGRSGGCSVRLDAADISGRHARIGLEDGQFWIEDLGSTNGTFVRGQQVSGRMHVDACEPIVLGRDVAIFCARSEGDLELYEAPRPSAPVRPERAEQYPIILSLSDVARPSRVPVVLGAPLKIGRDPSSDMWLGAPHVSRRHCEVRLAGEGRVEVEDFSMNGLAYPGGILHREEEFTLQGDPTVLNFGNGVTVAVCFSEEHETTFVASQGSPLAFASEEELHAARAKANRPRVPSAVPSSTEASGIFDTQQIRGVYRRLSLRGKLFVLFGLFLLGIVLIVVLRLAMPLFS